MTKVNIPYIMEKNSGGDSFLVRKDAKTNTYDKILYVGLYINYDNIKLFISNHERYFKKYNFPKDAKCEIDNDTEKRVFDSCITNYYKVSNVLKALNITYNMNPRISNFQKK